MELISTGNSQSTDLTHGIHRTEELKPKMDDMEIQKGRYHG